jgi:hypothetical protein
LSSSFEFGISLKLKNTSNYSIQTSSHIPKDKKKKLNDGGEVSTGSILIRNNGHSMGTSCGNEPGMNVVEPVIAS